MEIKIISQKEINESLKDSTRQYLVGNLQKPQILKHIHDENVEVGFSRCNSFSSPASHYHIVCTEYQYIINGKTKYLDLDTGKEYEVCKGDFFVIYPNTRYYQKVMCGTEILFMKYPGGNDKVLIELTEEQERWGREY